MGENILISNDIWSNEDTSFYSGSSRAKPANAYASTFGIDFGSENERGWESAFQRLDQINRYSNNWDGEGSDKPEQPIIDSAELFLNTMKSTDIFPPPSRISAGPDGELLLEWQFQDKYLEAEISEPFVAELMLVVEGENPLHSIFRINKVCNGDLIIAQERLVPDNSFISALCA